MNISDFSGDYSNIFIVSLICSIVTSMFSSYINNFITTVITYFTSKFIASMNISQKLNPDFYFDLLTLIEKQHKSRDNIIINNGNNIIPTKNIFIFNDVWCWLNVSYYPDNGTINIDFFLNYNIKNRFIKLQDLVLEFNKKK